MRRRPAPMARRTAISRCLADARASRRLATLEQAMRRTTVTTAIKTRRGLSYIPRKLVHPVPPGLNWSVPFTVDRLWSEGNCGGTRLSDLSLQNALRRCDVSYAETFEFGLARIRNQKLPRPSNGADSGLTVGSEARHNVTSATDPTLAPTNPRGDTPT